MQLLILSEAVNSLRSHVPEEGQLTLCDRCIRVYQIPIYHVRQVTIFKTYPDSGQANNSVKTNTEKQFRN